MNLDINMTIDWSLTYPLLAYFVMIWAVLRSWQCEEWLCTVISVVAVDLGFPYLLGIFGEPSVLTVALSFLFLFNQLPNRASLWSFTLGAWSIIGATLLGWSLYHDNQHTLMLVGQYIWFLFIFAWAIYWDKRAAYAMVLCVLGVMGSVMSSQMILDYVADVWLLLWSVGLLCQGVIRRFHWAA